MKRTLAILLCAALLLSCLPILSAGAKEIGIEQKFKLLLDDIEIAYPHHQANQYYFAELKKTDSWTLIRGGMRDLNQLAKTPDLHYATVGNKLVWSNKNSEPFKSGYGVYDAKSGAFYDLTDAWGRDFSGLRDAWNAMPGDEGDPRECGAQLIGDADSDNEVTILDATRIQRYVAELDDDPFTQTLKNDYYFGYPLYKCTDYDRDGDFTIMDATKVQRHIADLPNILDYKVAWDERYFPGYDSSKQYQNCWLINSLDELDLKDSRFATAENLDAEKKIRDAYDDSFFKDNSLLLLDISLGSGSYVLTLKNLSIDKDGLLSVNFTTNHPQVADGAVNDRFIAVEVSKAFVDDIRDIKVNITPDSEREKNYSYAMVFDKADRNYNGNKTASELITEYSQLDPANTYHKQLMTVLGEYPENPFVRSAYLLINLPLGSTSYNIDGVELSIDDHKILNVDVIAKGPEIGNAVVNTRFICVELSKDWLTDSEDYKVNLTFEFEDFSDYRPARLTSYEIRNPGNPMQEIYLYNNYTDLDPSVRSHQMLIDKYDANFFKDYSLVAINYDLPHSTLYQFDSFTVSSGTLKALMYETKTNSEDVSGKKHVWYVFEVSKRFLNGATKASIDRIVTDVYPENYEKMDIENAQFLPGYPQNNGYIPVQFKQLYTNEVEDSESSYIGPHWYNMKEEDPDLTGIVGIAGDPNELMSLCYELPEKAADSWPYERFPSHCPYDLKFFRSNAVVVLVHHDAYAGKTLKVNNIYIKDGKLLIDTELRQTADELVRQDTFYVTMVSVLKFAIRECDDIEIGRKVGGIYSEITPADGWGYLPDSLDTSGYYALKTEALSKVPTCGYNELPVRVNSQNDGLMMLIKSRTDLEYYIPGFDKEKTYDDRFFEDNAILATVMQGYDDSATLSVGNIYRHGITIYATPGISYHYSYDEYGTPIAQPTAPYRWDFKKISKSDIPEYVNRLDFWMKRGKTTPVSYTLLEKYQPGRSFVNDIVFNGFQISDASQVEKTITALFTDGSGYEYDHSDHTFEVEKKDEQYFENHDVIALRVHQASSDTTVDVKSVETFGSDLIVTIDRRYPSDHAIIPDEVDQIFFLEVPSSGSTYNVKYVINNIKVTDTSEYKAFVAPLTPADKRKSESYVISHAFDYKYITATEMESNKNTIVDYSMGDLHLNEENGSDYILLMRDKSEYDLHFGGIKTARNYSVSYFNDNALIAVVGVGNSGDAVAKIDSLAVTDAGGMLYSDARIDYPHPDLGATANTPLVWTIYQVKKSDVQNVSGIGFWNPDSMIREIVPEREKMNNIISESGEQCKLLSTDAYQITALSGTQQRYGDWSVFRMNETLTESGYVMVIKDARTFEKYFPATDFRQPYKGFFNYDALIVMVSRGSDDSAVAEMSDFAVVGQSLYVDAHTSTLANGEPSRPMIWTCVSVDKSDLDGVKEIRFWDSDSMIREIKPTNLTMDFIKTSNEDRYRALDSTAADIEPKSSQARYELSYSSLNLPKSELTGGYIMMIKDKATLDRHFPAARFNTEAYTDAYFKDNAIIAMVSRGGEDTARADLNALGIVGEQLYVDARVSYHPYFSSDGMLEEMPSSPMVWNFRQVKKSDISGVKSFAFWNSEAMIAPVFVRSGYVPDPTSEYVKDIKTTEITMSAPSESDFSWKPLGSSETGYTLILNSRAALEYYLPGFDTEKKYNDAFFKDSAIIAAVLRGNDATSAAHFGKIGLIYNTLFVNAYYTNNQPVIDGTPVAQPTTPTIWTFAKVSKADIKSIGDIQFWNAK